MKPKTAKKLPMKTKKQIAGTLFILPWFMGLVYFFLVPLVTTLVYAFSNYSAAGSVKIQPLENGIFNNFIDMFTKNTTFPGLYVDALVNLLYQVPIIVVLSIFVGSLLKTKFLGRTIMRCIFFLPVIVTTGVVSSVVRQSLLDVPRGDQQASTNIFNPELIVSVMRDNGIASDIADRVGHIITLTMDGIWLCGIQIIIILAGIMAIPQSHYEVASVEGATSWETTWKVVLPAIMPHILVVIVYSIVDSFTNYANTLMTYIVKETYSENMVSQGLAMFWVYFLTAFAIIGIVFLLSRKRIYYDS